jgi:hypothetical protein
MRTVGTRQGRVSILIGAGAGLAIVVLLVVQTVAPSGASGTSSETTTANSAGLSQTVVASSPGPLFNVAFFDGGPYGTNSTSGYHLTEWGVQLGNIEKTEPANITLSEIPENRYFTSSTFNLTRIVFSVPSGAYRFTLYPTAFLCISTPSGFFLGGSTGVVTVSGSNVTVFTAAPEFPTSC